MQSGSNIPAFRKNVLPPSLEQELEVVGSTGILVRFVRVRDGTSEQTVDLGVFVSFVSILFQQCFIKCTLITCFLKKLLFCQP